jgi:hypothetical protein
MRWRSVQKSIEAYLNEFYETISEVTIVKALLISCDNIYLTPYLSLYTDKLDQYQADYTILYWDKNSNEDIQDPRYIPFRINIKSSKDKLTFILRGGKPTFYFHSRFRTGAKNWMGETDLITDTDKDLLLAADIIAESVREYESLSDLQTVFMKDYEYQNNSALEIVYYENGTAIIGNFSDIKQEYQGRIIAPGEYIIVSADNE